MVKDAKHALVLAEAEEVRTETRASANHLPELHRRFDGPRENQVHDLRNVDPGIEHVDRDRYGQIVVGTFALEIVDQLLGTRIVVVDHLAELAGVLRIHFIEELTHQHRMLMVPCKYDALS